MARFIERETREQNLPTQREAHHPCREVRGRRDDPAAALAFNRGNLARVDADTRRERHLAPRPGAHRVLEQQRELHDLCDAVALGEIAVAHVLQNADAAALARHALEVAVVDAQRLSEGRDAMPRLQIRGTDEVGEKKDGKAVAKKLRDSIKRHVQVLVEDHKIMPGLAVVLVGDDPASAIYVANKEKAAKEVGMRGIVHRMPQNTSQDELLKLVHALNADGKVHGVLI